MEQKNIETPSPKGKTHFHTLTPLRDVDISVYADAIDFVFDHADVRNVAISGPYGAGKSSVLETYKKNNTARKFLHISLADFKSYNPADSDSENKSVESVLEGKILNQLLHQVAPERIPQTGFHIKQKVTVQRVCLDTLGIVAFIGLSLYLVFFQRWKAFVPTLEWSWKWMDSLLAWTCASSARLFLLLVEGVLFAWGTGYAIRKQRTTGILKKVSLQGNEFEIGRENDESLFDKYLNEVLYLFENADTDVIVFEDLDRHESSDIFTRLREINTLVNQHRSKKILRFFYLLRDDIFTTKDRAKFFDFIIPIVPVLDGSNAYDKFLAFFKQGGIEDLFTPHFLQGLSLYIDEMRILKNIINEFQVYYLRLNTTDLNSDKMLALITYKNIFPKDFSELQLSRGFVHELFDSVPDLVKTHRDDIRKRIAELEAQLSQSDQAFFTEQEIDTLRSYARSHQWNFDRTPLSKQLDLAKECYVAKKAVTRETLIAKINNANTQLAKLDRSKLRDVLSRANIDATFRENQHTDDNGSATNYEDIKGSAYFDLLKFLLRNGYIDESYSDYMTYFYPESLSKNDKAFLRSVADKKAKDWRYALDAPEKVITRLSLADFGESETLNFDLLRCLLAKENTLTQFVQEMLLQLKNGKNIRFVNDYLQTAGDSTLEFVRELNASWPGFFKIAAVTAAFQPEHRVLWARSTLCVSTDESIKAVNDDNCLCKLIAETPEFLDREPIDKTKLIHGMQLIGVEMKSIRREHANAELLKAVYENDLYALNAENVILMLNVFYGSGTRVNLGSQSFSEIIIKPNSPLAKRVLTCINDYLDIVFQTCERQIEDDEEDAIDILNNTSVSGDRKRTYIKLLRTIIECLDDVEDTSLWTDLLQHRKVVCSPANIVCYFTHSENTIDDVLIAFINDGNQLGFDFSDDALFDSADLQKAFFESVIVCPAIENSRYEAIIRSMKQDYPQFRVKGIPLDHVRILISLHKIKMSVESLVHIRQHYSGVIMDFIGANFDGYMDLMPDNLDETETRNILSSSVLNDAQKITLLRTAKVKISVQAVKVSEAVLLHILSNNLDTNDIPYLAKHYTEFPSAIRSQIVLNIVTDTSLLIAERLALPISLLDTLVQSEAIPKETKVELFTNSLAGISDAVSCRTYLGRLGLNELDKVFNNGRPKIQNTAVNIRILDHFKKVQWIVDYSQDTANPAFLKITKQKSAGGDDVG